MVCHEASHEGGGIGGGKRRQGIDKFVERSERGCVARVRTAEDEPECSRCRHICCRLRQERLEQRRRALEVVTDWNRFADCYSAVAAEPETLGSRYTRQLAAGAANDHVARDGHCLRLMHGDACGHKIPKTNYRTVH